MGSFRLPLNGWNLLQPIWNSLGAAVSLNEGTPVVLIEALASGIPAVATNVGGVRDVVEDGRSGHLVKSNDVESFSRSLVTLLTDADMRKRFGQHGKRFVEGKYSKEKLLHTLEDLYSKGLEKKGRI